MLSTKFQNLIVPTLAVVLALSGCGGGESGPPQQGAPPVTVATPLVQDVVDWDEYVGRFEAVENVEVRPRASGAMEDRRSRQ